MVNKEHKLLSNYYESANMLTLLNVLSHSIFIIL